MEPGGITPPVPGPDGSVGDQATVTVSPAGKVTVAVGTSGHGQGHETAYAQPVGRELGVPYEDVTVVFGDTDTTPFGYGTFGSRSRDGAPPTPSGKIQRFFTQSTFWVEPI